MSYRRGHLLRRLTLSAVFVLLVAAVATGCSAVSQNLASQAVEAENPNVILIVTDDLDTRLIEDNLDSFPNIRKLSREGVDFRNAFVSNSLCCPSRATILTGRYSHNTGVYGNEAPDGGWSAFKWLEDKTLPVYMKKAGYSTGFYGKYMNNFNKNRKPAGWDEFEYIGGSLPGYEGKQQGLQADALRDEAISFIRAHDDKPFYLQMMPVAPHKPAVPAPRHKNAFAGLKAPKTPSFNEKDVSDKPPWVRKRGKLSRKQVKKLNRLYRNQARTMLAVDEMLGSVRQELRRSGKLDNTYIFFTSDNGYHRGQHRLRDGKRLAYEEDIRIPLYVTGPGVKPADRPEFVLNNDFAPTVADLAGTQGPPKMDGSSFAPILRGQKPPWRKRFLVEASSHERLDRPAFKAVRTKKRILVDYARGRDELYNISRDPHQLRNSITTAPKPLKRNLRKKLTTLRKCEGVSCKRAEGF